jgi:hypothetical protein
MRGLERLPAHMRDAMRLWIERGLPHPALLGSFLRAVLKNDLLGAFAAADADNSAAMRSWALFLYNDAPSPCRGDDAALLRWHERGGLLGPVEAQKAAGLGALLHMSEED